MSGRGRVLLAAPRSFCAGVDRAIEIVERLLEQHGPPVYVRHQIVHNEHVVRRLESLGAVFVESEDEIPPGRGERPESTVVIESPEEARRLETQGKPIAVVTQTTLSLDDVAPIVDALEEHVGTLRRPAADDICYATQNRQDAVKELHGRGATLILVIGSETSSNAQRLVEVARSAGAEAALVDGESPLEDELLAGHSTIGLTAGASTPEELVELVAARLAERGYDTLEEITVAREDVHFRLPREVASA